MLSSSIRAMAVTPNVPRSLSDARSPGLRLRTTTDSALFLLFKATNVFGQLSMRDLGPREDIQRARNDAMALIIRGVAGFNHARGFAHRR